MLGGIKNQIGLGHRNLVRGSNMTDAILTLDQLKIATGYSTASAVEQCLRKNGVRFLYGKSGIYTTVDALNAAMGLKSEERFANDSEIHIL